MYRKRDSGMSYSSADAYRSLQNTAPPGSSHSHAAHSSSSEEEAQLTLRRGESPSSFPDSSADHHYAEDSTPLDPPRPFFLEGGRKNSKSSERGSWSSATDSVDLASDSDRDNEAAAAAAAGGPSPAGVRRVRANTAGSTTTPSAAVRPRNHHRRKSSSTNAPAAAQSPFDTPTQTPMMSRAPPSSFPFLSHAGNPDPGTPLPAGMGRRGSRESFRRYSGVPASPGTPATSSGVAYPNAGGADGYSALRAERTSMDVADGYAYAPVNANDQDDLGRPQAPFMADGERANWQPANGSGGSVYRNSAAAAMTGSTAALTGGRCMCWVYGSCS